MWERKFQEMNLPTTIPAQRIAILFNRRLTTEWNLKEVKAYKSLAKAGAFDSLDDLEMIERYYISERRKGEKGIQRRDLATFLNNWNGELDRAREWNARRPSIRGVFNPKRYATIPVDLRTDEQVKADGAVVRRLTEELRQKLVRVL